MQITSPVPKQNPPKPDEQILVVKRSHLFPEPQEAWHGLKNDVFTDFFERVQLYQEFQPRSLMETDPNYKQIIPYLVFTHEETFFLMQRTAVAGEQRLKNKYTLGIGGHIRKEDLLTTSHTIMNWAEREFHEEVSYSGNYTVQPLGILNDDSNLVGQVHLGFVLLVTGDSSSISIKSELKSGDLYSLDECDHFYDSMEGWSQMVVTHLRSLKESKE